MMIMIQMNAVMEHIFVPLMRHVPIQLALTAAPVILDLLEMEEPALTLTNVLMGHIHVKLVPLVPIQLAHTAVYASALFHFLEMEEHAMMHQTNVLMEHILVLLMPHALTQ